MLAITLIVIKQIETSNEANLGISFPAYPSIGGINLPNLHAVQSHPGDLIRELLQPEL